MKVAVTGGSGQLGGVILRRLIDDRSVKAIVSIDMRPPAQVSGKLRWVKADVRDVGIAEHLEGVDALFHLAFIVTKRTPRAQMEDINVGGSTNVFRAAASRKVKKIIYASSIAAYGIVDGHPVPLTEDAPRKLQADFPYSADKYAVEAFLDDFEREVGPDLSIVRIRPSVLIGAHMQNPLARYLGRLMNTGRFPDLGAPPMPLVWDEDAADAMMLALKKDVRGAFNVSADDPATAEQIAHATGLKLIRIPKTGLVLLDSLGPILERVGIGEAVDPSWRKEGAVAIDPSSERAKTVLGWKPRHLRSVDVIKRFVEIAPGTTDRRILALFRIINLSGLARRPYDDLQTKGLRAHAHLCLTGKGGGDFGLIVEEEKMKVLFEAPRPPTSVATLPASLFLDMLAGRASFATAQLTGRVRMEGDPVVAFLLSGMIARYQQLGQFTGVRGIATRALTRWINQGGTP
jgi:nucleoside-diphosphate-sugar epimerase/putative sterol carrier protein